ncbi:MAG: TIGR02270 family protein [Aquabacterium sp.]
MAIIENVIRQHLDEAEVLRHVRTSLVRAPHVELHRLQRLDERMAAHLDGLFVAGDAAAPMVTAALASPTVGLVFVGTVLALQSRHAERLHALAAIAEAVPELEAGFLSGLGWVSAPDLQGAVRALLGSQTPRHRAWGLQACAMHRVDPGPTLNRALEDADDQVRAVAWRVAGQMGRDDLKAAAATAVRAGSIDAARALTLWGGVDDVAREVLLRVDEGQTLPRLATHRLLTLASSLDWGREQVRTLVTQAEGSAKHKRRMLQMAGWLGDAQVVPWLIQNMADDVWARAAGEAWSLMTGADLAALGLERPPPERVAAGPSDAPEDEDVAMDEDDGLPWPDVGKVQAWWRSHAGQFVAGHRFFAGATPTPAHCWQRLRSAGQRQRIMAAEHLCLLQRGGQLFPVAAPAWRQSRWLAAMSSAPSGVGSP